MTPPVYVRCRACRSIVARPDPPTCFVCGKNLEGAVASSAAPPVLVQTSRDSRVATVILVALAALGSWGAIPIAAAFFGGGNGVGVLVAGPVVLGIVIAGFLGFFSRHPAARTAGRIFVGLAALLGAGMVLLVAFFVFLFITCAVSR